VKEGAPGQKKGKKKKVNLEEDMTRSNGKPASVLAGFQTLPSLGSRQHAARLAVLAERTVLSPQAFLP